MNIYLELLIVAAVVVYIVDISGFTDAWLSWLSRALKGPVKSVRPFSCSKCMTWWCVLLWAAVQGKLSIMIIGYAAALALLSNTIYAVLLFIKQWTLFVIHKLMPPEW